VILQRGRLVADAATADLLDGDAGTYEIVVRGDGAAAAPAGHPRPRGDAVGGVGGSDATTLTVRLRDAGVADALLPAVIGAGDVVTTFGRRRSSLEDAFLTLVEKERG
jgi:hypothetical protein